MNRNLLLAVASLVPGLVSGCDSSTPQPVATSDAAQVAPGSELASGAANPAAGVPLANDPPALSAANLWPASDDNSPSPSLSAPEASNSADAARLTPSGPTPEGPLVPVDNMAQRPFRTLQPLTSDDPQALVAHLQEIDAALQDLVLAGTANFVDEKSFTESGLRLGRMKQAAGQQLARAPQATSEQRKAGVIAELVALSHMSGLRDISAAQELERFAQQLSASDDIDLAHQARVVLIGFELQALQNGLHQQPDNLLSLISGLFPRQQDRGFPEFMVLQQAQQVLAQMGFAEASEEVRQGMLAAYRSSPDPQLRGEAWLMEVQSSQAYQNFVQAFRDLGTERFDSASALVAIRGLYEAFPTLQTVEQIATTIANIEYSGYVPLSQDVARLTHSAMASFPEADTRHVEKALQDHATRTSLMGNTITWDGLVGFDGQPLDWNEYSGKVVLVDFWASWCLKCLREIPTIRQVHQEFADRGFAVLSINMDENLVSGRECVTSQRFPWRSFHSSVPDQLGFQSPLARRLGVNAIPFMLVLDRQGRVAALHVRGEALRPAVEKLLATDAANP